jgi:hypothetical protein
MNRKSLNKKWIAHVNAYKQSGQSLNGYCRENGLKQSTFRYWVDKEKYKKVLETEVKKHEWLPLKIEKPMDNKDIPDTRISVKIGSAIIEIGDGFKKDIFKEIVDILVLSC